MPSRFRPRALPALAAIAAVAVFVSVGNWQGRRMHEKEALRDQFDAATAMASIELPTATAATDWSALRYRSVVVSGAYDAQHQVLLDNRVHDGHAGYHVVTPLALVDGRVVLVNRGWTPVGASRATTPAVAPPRGRVSVVGRIAIPSSGFFELAASPPAGPVWQNLDPGRFATATGVGVLPVMIEATQAPVPDDGLVREWPAPDFGVEKHRIYQVQWYLFAALAVVFWIVVQFRRHAPRPHD